MGGVSRSGNWYIRKNNFYRVEDCHGQEKHPPSNDRMGHVTGKRRKRGESWDPRSLEGKEDRDVFKPWERIPDIVFTLALLLVFNFYPQWIGIFFTDKTTGMWIHVPFLSQTFFQYLPWLNILWLAGLSLNFALLRTGKWLPWSRWFQIGIDVLTMSIFIWMASGNPIVQFAPEKLNQLGEIGTNLTRMQPLINKGVYALLILLVIITGVDLVQSIVRIARKK